MNARKTPITPLGGIADDVHHRACESWRAAVAHHAAVLPPCSNTGGTLEPRSGDAPAFVDYCSFTLRGLRAVLSRIKRDRPEPDGLDSLRAMLFDTAKGDWDVTATERERAASLLEKIEPDCTGCLSVAQVSGPRLDFGLAWIARNLLEAVAPALVFGELTGRGLNGYKNHLKIFTHLGEQCGSIAMGGNRETVGVILTGQACRRVDMAKLADALDGFDFKLTRVDAAWDDLDGRYGAPHDAATNYDHGGFKPERGPRSNKVLLYDDRGSGAGSTFQLGNRTGRLLRIYSKGQQLGDAQSPWVRYEVQMMGVEFDLTLDHLRSPGVLLHQYPDLSHLPVDGTGDPAMRVQAEAEISTDRLVRWLATTCGPALTLLGDSVGSWMTLELLRNEKTPRRLRRIADSRKDIGHLVADALLDARKFAPIAASSIYLSAEQRER